MKNLAVCFYRDLFATDLNVRGQYIRGGFPNLGADVMSSLGEEFSMKEVKSTLRDIGSFKAPDPDGFHALFFKKTWSFIGQALFSFVQKVMDEQMKEAKVLMVLIP